MRREAVYGKTMKLAPIINPDARRPMPKPVRVNLRRVFLAGMALWLIALVVCVALMTLRIPTGDALWVIISGLGVGIALLIWEKIDRDHYTQLGR